MNTIIEYETLGKFVDSLIDKKYPNQPPADLSNLREKIIIELDDQISKAIFDKLTNAQVNEINAMFDSEENDPAVFQSFFKNAGVDLEQVISNATMKFTQSFLGGSNA